MNTKSANLMCAAFIAALLIYVSYIYSGLPDPMPTHWDMAGNANDYMSRIAGTIILLGVPVFSVAVFKVIPLISPRGYRTDEFTGIVNSLMVGTVLFGCFICVVAMNKALGADLDIGKVTLISVGVLIAFIGNLMGKVRKNFFIGIRTPWTLASDEVWVKTHRLAGWCMVLTGIAMAVGAFFERGAFWAIVAVVGSVLIPIVYSYFAYRAVEGFAPDDDKELDSDA